MIDPRLEADLAGAEGSRLYAYRDSEGNWTIGRGHLLLPQSHDWRGYTITAAEEETLFDSDILVATAFAQRLPEWPALDTDCRRNAVIELCFNLGGKWLGFVLCRAAIERHDWQAAHDQLLNSLWAREVGSERSNRLADYLLTGEYPVPDQP